jgi:Uncharacterized protein conserved in bacteria (DUF2252)
MTDETVIGSTVAYERWLARHVAVVPEDLARKHRLMRRDAFTFLRATYYRFVERFPVVCPELVDAYAVGAVGDLHVENFGTWRDAEGRLVWGIDDLDEADRLPYTLDLARLVSSALVAAEGGRLDLGRSVVAEAILSGYRRAIEDGTTAVVLAERRRWLVNAFAPLLHEPREFWQALADLPAAGRRLGPAARAVLELAKPGRGWKYRLHRRTAGVGSLGRPRIVAVGEWDGGLVARELKALPPPATRRPGGLGRGPWPARRHYGDPWAAEHSGWVVRRLAPDNVKLELARIDRRRADRRLLTAMGREVARYHLRSRGAKQAIAADLAARPKGWLAAAGEALVSDVRADFDLWRKQ